MEYKHHPIKKENHLPNLHFWVPCIYYVLLRRRLFFWHNIFQWKPLSCVKTFEKTPWRFLCIMHRAFRGTRCRVTNPHLGRGKLRHLGAGSVRPTEPRKNTLLSVESWWWFNKDTYLVGGWTTQLKNMLVKLDHFPRDRGENKKYLSCHHLVIMAWS